MSLWSCPLLALYGERQAPRTDTGPGIGGRRRLPTNVYKIEFSGTSPAYVVGGSRRRTHEDGTALVIVTGGENHEHATRFCENGGRSVSCPFCSSCFSGIERDGCEDVPPRRQSVP